MRTEDLGAIAMEINLKLIKQGLSDADIVFIGMNLVSYGISSTTASILSKEQKSQKRGMN